MEQTAQVFSLIQMSLFMISVSVSASVCLSGGIFSLTMPGRSACGGGGITVTMAPLLALIYWFA